MTYVSHRNLQGAPPESSENLTSGQIPLRIRKDIVFERPTVNLITEALHSDKNIGYWTYVLADDWDNIHVIVNTVAGGFRSKKRKRTNTRSNRRYRKTKKINKINKRKYKIKKNRRRFRKKY